MGVANVNLKLRNTNLNWVPDGCPQCQGKVLEIKTNPEQSVKLCLLVEMVYPNRVMGGRYFADVRPHVCRVDRRSEMAPRKAGA
jgi:hypothetical protein